MAVLALAASGYLAFHTDKEISSRRATLSSFDASARTALSSLADVRAGQQAYVAAGQGVAFWMPKVATLVETAEASVESLRTEAASGDARAALMEAAASVTEFKDVDKRARDYVKSNQALMAADVIFTEGGDTAASAATQVQTAAVAEHQAFDQFAASQKKAQVYSLGAGAAIAVLTLMLLAGMTGADDAAADVVESEAPALITPQPGKAPVAPQAPAPVREIRETAPVLKAAAALCTDFGRVKSSADLTQLLTRAADALEASGLIVWLGTAAGGDLRPVLAHGYAAELLARMPSIPRSANNAAATAYRTASFQIVLARPGGPSGALVAPLLSADGCIGALTAEIRSGGESSDAVQSLAAIFAAQLAGILAASAQVADADSPRAAAL